MKKLVKYLNILNVFKCKKTSKLLPSEFDSNERIVRSVFHPINLNKKGTRLRSNTFKPPYDLDEISVNRLDYTTEDYCKSVSKEIQLPEHKRNYFGLALLRKYKICDCDCDVVYSPLEKNVYHSDIKIGYILKRGETIPAEVSHRINQLTENANLFKDPKPLEEKWHGGKVE